MPAPDLSVPGTPCWIELFTADTDQARAFYGELFGWTSEDAGPEYGGYINFSKDGQRVAGLMANDTERPNLWTVYLASPDARKTCELAESHGGQVVVGPMDVMQLGVMAVLGDPGGNGVGVWQPGEHTGFGVITEPGTPAWFELHTTAYEATVAFYRDVFNWDARTMSDTPEFRYTTLGEGDAASAGIMDDAAGTGWNVYIACADTDATAAKATSLGGSVVEDAQDTPYGRLAVVTDPAGTPFRVMGPNQG